MIRNSIDVSTRVGANLSALIDRYGGDALAEEFIRYD